MQGDTLACSVIHCLVTHDADKRNWMRGQGRDELPPLQDRQAPAAATQDSFPFVNRVHLW